MDVVGQGQLLGDLADRIVIAADREDSDAGVTQPLHLAQKKEACVVILPVAVVNIADDKYEGNLLFKGKSNEVLKRSSRRSPQFINGRTIVPLEAPQWAVQVNIGRMNEFHVA